MMKKLLIVITTLLSLQLMAVEGVVQLHIDQFASRYQTYESHPALKMLNNGDQHADSIFQNSKLFLRLKEEFQRVNQKHNFFTPKQLKKLPDTALDLFLYDIQTLDYLVRLTLDQPQFLTITSLKLEELQSTTVSGQLIYQRGTLYFGFNESNLCLSAKQSRVAACLGDSARFTLKSDRGGYQDMINVDVQRIWNTTPYLKVYWLQKDKSLFQDMISAKFYFNLKKKSLNEYGILQFSTLPKILDIDGVATLKGINVINRQGGLTMTPIDGFQGMTLYQRVIQSGNNFSEVVVGKLEGSLEDLKLFLTTKYPKSLWKKEGGMISFQYGLMNHQSLFIKTISKSVILSASRKMVQSIKTLQKESAIVNISADGVDLRKMADQLQLWKSSTRSKNYSYNQFLDHFLSGYLKAIQSFQFIVRPDQNQFTYTTEIKF